MKIRISLRDLIVLVGVIFLPILVIWAIIFNFNKDKELNANCKYTIGNAYHRYDAPGQTIINYTFTVNGIIYNGEVSKWVKRYSIPGHYVVKYSTKNPKYNEMINVAVPDSIKAPDNGWDSIPGRCYGVGKIENIFSSNKTTIEFEYKLQTLYIVTTTNFLTHKDVGKIYFLSFFPGNPAYDLRIYNEQVPDSIYINAPEVGWVKKPW
ncbi:MAG TPA: hypothetical protein VNG53_07075 [Bacteroidia bacterium]|nr:hypothetical protein [Bacteroidia bacterium]